MTFEEVRVEVMNSFKLNKKIANRLNEIESERGNVEIIRKEINEKTAEMLIEVQE